MKDSSHGQREWKLPPWIWVWNLLYQNNLRQRLNIMWSQCQNPSTDSRLPITATKCFSFTWPVSLSALHPRKLTWIPKIAISERSYILKTIILGIHVSFRECTHFSDPNFETNPNEHVPQRQFSKPVAPRHLSSRLFRISGWTKTSLNTVKHPHVPSRERSHIPPWEKENHLQTCSQEGIYPPN